MLTFVQPSALLALLALLPLWLLAFASRRMALERRGSDAQQRRVAHWLGVLLPSIAIVALVGALAGAQIVVPERALTVVFLLDRSDSVAPNEQARAEAYLKTALAALPPDDQAGLVVFGQRGSVVRLPSSDRLLEQIVVAVPTDRSDIGGAVQLGLSLLPAEGRRRLVLLSDGNQNLGDAATAAQVAATRNVPLDVVPLGSGTSGFDVQITSLDLPTRTRHGQQLRLAIDTNAPAAVAAIVTISANGTPIVTTNTEVAAGRGTIYVDLPEPATGFNRYAVQLDVANDVRTQNNRAETFTVVSGPPRFLLIAADPSEASPLRNALAATRATVDLIAPAALPTTLGALSRYDGIVLVNVAFGALPAAADTLLPAYVRDLGRGLAMIGGPQSLGAGGYRGSQIEGALPVTMDPRPDIQSPPVAMVVLIDVSGSMAKYAGDSTKLQLAAGGTVRIADQLRDDDTLTIIPFDRMPSGTIGPLAGRERATVPERLKSLFPGSGGINIFDGLQLAKRYLDRATQQVRHLIVLTDGDDTVQKEGADDLVRGLNEAGVTVTTVAVGGGRDVAFVRGLARQGGGRFFLSENATSLPTIMADEARFVLHPYLLEGAFTPQRTAAASSSPLLRGIGDLPPISGYVASQPKERATLLVRASADDPLLATWQYGLGHSLVWTSDMNSRWNGALVQSPRFPQLVAQLTSWLLPPPQSERLALAAQPQGDALLLTVTTADETGHTIDGLQVAGQLIGPDGRGRAIALREQAPGVYGTLVQSIEAGSYAVELTASDATGLPVASATGGAVLANTSEYRDNTANTALLTSLARQTNGLVDPLPAAIFEAPALARGRPVALAQPLLLTAMLVLPLTVLVRRLRLRLGAPQVAGVPTRDLALADRIWFMFFGDTPFRATTQQRKQRRREQQAWASWIHEQAQQTRRATKEPGDGRRER